jgi:hypothetical protein
MAKIFRTPLRTTRPPITRHTPEKDIKPAIFFRKQDLVAVGVNVYLLNDNTVTEKQPRYWTDVKTFYQGGAENIISDDEAAFLVAANPEYAACLFPVGGVVTPPTGGPSGYGVGAYGVGPYGA